MNRKDFSEELIAKAVNAFEALSLDEKIEVWCRVDVMQHGEVVAHAEAKAAMERTQRQYLAQDLVNLADGKPVVTNLAEAVRVKIETLLKERRHLERGARIARDLLAAKDAAVGLPPEERVWLERERARDV